MYIMYKKFSLANLSKMANKEIVENKVISTDKDINLKKTSTLLIDGSYMFVRAFSIGTSKRFDHQPSEKTQETIVNIFFKSLFAEINRNAVSNNILVIFDGKDTTKKRREIFPDYKMNRGGGVTSKKSFRNILKEVVGILQNDLPIKTLIANGYEADDAIAYIANTILPNINESNIVNTIISADRDFEQLLSDNIIIYSPNKKEYVTKDIFMNKHNMLPQNYIFEKIITGDTSDNIKGLYRIGKMMVKKHLTEQLDMTNVDYSESFDLFYDTIENHVDAKRIKESIFDNKELLKINYRIMSLGIESVSDNIPNSQKSYIIDLVKANPLFGEDNNFNIVKMLNILKLDVNSTNTTNLNNIINRLRN